MTPRLAACNDPSCFLCSCHDHGQPDPLRAPGTDDSPRPERPRSGWLIVWVAVILMVVGLLLAGYAFMGMRS